MDTLVSIGKFEFERYAQTLNLDSLHQTRIVHIVGYQRMFLNLAKVRWLHINIIKIDDMFTRVFRYMLS